MPNNPFAEELQRRESPMSRLREQFPLLSGATEQRRPEAKTAGEFASRRFVDNLLALPSASGDVLAGGAALAEGVGAMTQGQPFNIGERFRQQQQQLPASAIRAIPRPTTVDIEGAIRAIPSMVDLGASEAYRQGRETAQSRLDAMREAEPMKAAAGEIGGDIATVVTGRAPFARGIANAERRLMASQAGQLAPGAERLAERVMTSPTMLRLGRGLGRSAETGFEAAVMEAINGDDPLQAAGFAAGAQMVGSGMLEASSGLLSGGPMRAGIKTTIAAGAIMGLTQLLKSATPGDRDRILESAETGYDKVAFTLALGAASTMLGAGRGRSGKLAEDVPELVDAIAATPRAAAISLLTRWNGADESERAEIESALSGLASDPEYQGTSDTERAVINTLRSSMNPFDDELSRRTSQ